MFGVEHAEHFSSHSWVSEAVGNTTPSWAYVREHIHARAQIQLWNRYWAPEFGLSSSGLVSVKGWFYTSLSLLWLLPMVGYGVLVCSVSGAAQGNAGWGTQRDTWGLNNLGEILLGIKTQDMYFYYYYYYYYSHFVFWTKCFLFCEALLQLGEVIIFHEVASNSAVLTLRLTKHAQLWFFWRRIYSNICW